MFVSLGDSSSDEMIVVAGASRKYKEQRDLPLDSNPGRLVCYTYTLRMRTLCQNQ